MMNLISAVMVLVVCDQAVAQETKGVDRPLFADKKDAFGDPLPPGAITRIGTTRYRLSEYQQGHYPLLSPDGKLLASTTSGGEITIRELPAWTPPRVLHGCSY